MWLEFSIAFAYWLWALWPALAIWAIGFSAMSAIWRNPSASQDIRTTMILAIAFAEALWIFAFVVAMVLKFVA